jgi:hypothetical protein
VDLARPSFASREQEKKNRKGQPATTGTFPVPSSFTIVRTTGWSRRTGPSRSVHWTPPHNHHLVPGRVACGIAAVPMGKGMDPVRLGSIPLGYLLADG